MKTIKIIDYIPSNVSQRKLHPAGYLLLPKCPIARSGILEYSDVIGQDGKLINNGLPIKVYRPPEAIKKCLSYYNNLPMSVTHPSNGAVDPSMVQEVIVGTTSGNATLQEIEDGEVEVVVDIMIHEEDAIKMLQDGKYEELSAGYETAYKKERGVTNTGKSFEALQFHLMPNHIALVEKGRCGAECRVCDHNENIISKGAIMKLVKTTDEKKFRYFLRSDSEENGVIELSQEAFDEISKAEDVEVEELEEKDVEIQSEDTSEEVEVKDEKVEDEYEEDEEELEEEVEVPGVEDEEIVEEIPGEEVEEDEEVPSESEIFEVELEDGVIGKMDKVAYEYFKRYMEMQKKGDSMDSAAQIMSLAATAERILGTSFQVDSYINDGKFNSKALKRAVIKKQMPNIVVKSLKNDEALNSMFECAIETSKQNVKDWKADMTSLTKHVKTTDEQPINSVEKARRARLNIINRVKETK